MKTISTKKIITALILFITVIGFLSCGSSRRSIAIEEGWELLGESKVDFIRDKDQVDVISSNRYTALRFKVEKRDIRLNDLNVVYQNGDKLSPVIDDVIVADQYSRDIELGPEGKSIRSVDFKYRTTGSMLKGRGNVLLFGKRYVPPINYNN
jgi:hypothetical protein